jgi:hypothetical protein
MAPNGLRQLPFFLDARTPSVCMCGVFLADRHP